MTDLSNWTCLKRISEVWVSPDGSVVVLGVPPDESSKHEEDRHNCDFMGCGQDHVLLRATSRIDAAKLATTRSGDE